MNSLSIKLKYDKALKAKLSATSYLHSAEKVLNNSFDISDPVKRQQRAKLLASYSYSKDRLTEANQLIEKYANMLGISYGI